MAENDDEKDVLDATGSSDKTAKESIQNAKRDVKVARNIGKSLMNVVKAIAKIPYAGPIIIGVIVAIIIIIGFYYFFSTMPGIMMAKIKEIAQGAIDKLQSIYTNEADAETNKQDVVDLANYLEEMDYDLVGYGFVIPDSDWANNMVTGEDLKLMGYTYGKVELTNDNGETTTDYRYYKRDNNGNIILYGEGSDGDGEYYNSIGDLIDNLTGETVDEYYDEYGIQRSKSDNDEITKKGLDNVDSKLLRTYLLSDYRIYNIRNYDAGEIDTLTTDKETMWNILKLFIPGINVLEYWKDAGQLVEFYANQIYTNIKETFGGYDSAWAKGLLKFYNVSYDSNNNTTSIGLSDVIAGNSKVNLEINDKTLIVQTGTFNNEMTYSIDGWSDRYGMSLEFLLSLHLATGAPDLVYAMLQSFDTEVQVYLGYSGDAEVYSGYVDLYDTDKNIADIVTWDNIKTTLEEGATDGDLSDIVNLVDEADTWFGNSVNETILTRKSCQYLLTHIEGLTSPPNCEGQAQMEVIVDGTYDKSKNYLLQYDYLYEIDDDDLIDEIYDFFKEDDDGSIDYSKNDFYKYENDGKEVDFSLKNLSYGIGIDAKYEESEEYDRICEVAINNGYKNDDAEVKEESYKYKGESLNASSHGYGYGINNSVNTSNTYDVNIIDVVKTERTWKSNAYDDESDEDVTYKWVTYTYNVYESMNGEEIEKHTYFGSEEERNNPDYIDSYDKGDLIDTFVIEWISRDKSTQEKIDENIIDEETHELIDKGNLCSSHNWKDLKKCCKNCKNYVEDVVMALANVRDSDYYYYTPYIARVLGSWFRDTYFVIPSEADAAINDYTNETNRSSVEMAVISNSYGYDGKYVLVDDDYLYETEEYWTAYEMKDTDGDCVGDDYQLYYLEPDGITSEETTMEDFLVDNNYLSSTDVTEDELEEAKEKAEEDGHAFVKKAKIDESLIIESLDMGSETVWSAYDFHSDGAETAWQKILFEEDGNDYVDDVYNFIDDEDADKNIDGGFYYKISTTSYVKQQEDAKRSETNPTVKWLFKYRQYYLYDGTDETAERINEDREKVLKAVQKYLKDNYLLAGDVAKDLGKYGRNALRQTYSNLTLIENWDDVAEEWLEWQLDMYYSGVVSDYYNSLTGKYVTYGGKKLEDIDWSKYGLDNDRAYGDPRDPDLIGTVNITKNSLNAFSILENTKTLAADYAYRDFKELIVELDYFDKEDLSDKVDSVFTWLVPDVDMEGWPLRIWDKQDTDYGALIGSKSTYEYLKSINYDPNDSESEEEEEESETDDENSENEDESESIVVAEAETEFEGYEGGELVVSPVTGEVVEYGEHERTNIYTGEKETVGYIVLEPLKSKDTFVGSGSGNNVSKNSGDVDDLSDEDIAEGLNLFYDEYEDVCIGYTITIDGFKTESNGKVQNVTDDDGINGEYEKNNVTPLYNKSEQEEREKEEDKKEKAPFWVKVDSDTFYIKEGKYIGWTYTDDEAGQTNYIRIIVEDEYGNIIDNVEDYFDYPDIEYDSSSGISSASYEALNSIDVYSTDQEKVISIMSYFIEQGFTEQAAAGIVGNLILESTLNPTNGTNYIGLAQWDSARWSTVTNWMKSNGYNDNYSFEGQVRAIYESGDRNINWEELASITDVDKAAEYFCVYYEGASGTVNGVVTKTQWYKKGKEYQRLDLRMQYANNAIKIYQGENIGIKD